MMNLGEILSQALGPRSDDDPWADPVIETAVEMVAEHYRLDHGDVWAVTFELADEMEEQTGLPAFGRLFERPWGFTQFADCVAYRLLGEDADLMPRLSLGYH